MTRTTFSYDRPVATEGPEAQAERLYLIVERFREGPGAVYARFRDRGRMAPDGLAYIASWVTEDGRCCYQVMSCADPTLLEAWMANWRDLVDFEVIPVTTSSEATARFGGNGLQE